MSLADEGKVIIEVGLNETTSKEQNPTVAYGPAEVAADAAACAAAGAAVGHFHSRRDDGSQDWTGAEIYRRGMELTAELSDIILYPSYLGDHSHIWALSDDPPVGAPLTIASFDVPQEVTRPVLWNEATRSFEEPPFEVTGAPATESDLLGEMARRGLRPTAAAFDVGQLRWIVLALRAGILPSPLYVKIFLFDQLVNGPFANASGIDAYLSQVSDDVDIELTLVPYTMSSPERADELVRAALERGLNVRVGIGDNPDAYPTMPNAELVAHAADLVAEAGFVPATPAEVRERLQLATLAERA